MQEKISHDGYAIFDTDEQDCHLLKVCKEDTLNYREAFHYIFMSNLCLNRLHQAHWRLLAISSRSYRCTLNFAMMPRFLRKALMRAHISVQCKRCFLDIHVYILKGNLLPSSWSKNFISTAGAPALYMPMIKIQSKANFGSVTGTFAETSLHG